MYPFASAEGQLPHLLPHVAFPWHGYHVPDSTLVGP